MSNGIKTIFTKLAPAPVTGAPYSQAVLAGGFLYISGQVPLLPDGSKVDGGFGEQVKQTLTNLQQVLKAGGASVDDVVKVNIFLSDMSLFGAFNDIYKTVFVNHLPARSCVAAAQLPMNFPIEVEAVAYVPNA